jgi:predicted RNase H-like HicB family nuclease/uncharacterized damage-inducible protein DinB
VEEGLGGAGAFVPDCPGCWVFGRNQESALEKAKNAVFEWFNWLGKHRGSTSVRPTEIEVQVVELLKVNYNPVEAGKPEPLFWSEVLPIKKEDITRTIRLMNYSRKDLLNLVTNLDEEILNWKPPEEPRTIENCLRHIAYVEPWYVTRLNIKLSWRFPKNVFELLNHTRRIVIEHLKNLPKGKTSGVFQPLVDRSPICNLWTARKVLRRLVDHEMLHRKYIEKALRLHTESMGEGRTSSA